MKIVVVGNGYIGSRIYAVARDRGYSVTHRSHTDVIKYACNLLSLADVVINAAAYIKDGRADACEDNKADTVMANLVFPARLSDMCSLLHIPLLHISTACMFNGHPEGGWTEEHVPQLSWRSRSDCGTYVGSKQLAEECIRQNEMTWIARVRLPFDGIDNPRNFLSKIRNYDKVYDDLNSLAHRDDFANACLDMIRIRVPFGTYNVLNQGAIWTHDIIDMMNKIPKLARQFVYWDKDEFMEKVARTPKSNCTISVRKLLSCGINMRPVGEAVEESLRNWN